jgi:integrase
VGALSGSWQWLIRRGHLVEGSVDPWRGQAPRKRKADVNGRDAERAFTDAEVVQLLSSAPGPTFPDFLRVAALSGMRREEIGQLTVADCVGGVFVVQGGKTDAAARRVPIHSALVALVEARLAHKAPTAFLFHEIGSKNAKRTGALGKSFTRYRRTLGIQEGTGRRSQVNLHSFRRWFITAAVNAQQAPHMVSLVVGHAEGRKGMTVSRYWQGADDGALRAVVESVRLPTVASL